MAASPRRRGSVRAFKSAFDKKVVPVSSGAATPSDAWLTGCERQPLEQR